MTSFITALGLSASTKPATIPIPNYGPSLLITHFVFAFLVLAPRHAKQYFGIDHQVSPREDIAKYGEPAVKAGKLTQRQLNMIKRNDSAQANSIENFSLFAASLVFASVAGVDRVLINRAGVMYTFGRVCYALTYIFVDHPIWSFTRAMHWWVGNGSCLYLLWKAGGALNG